MLDRVLNALKPEQVTPMFTGLIEEIGIISVCRPHGEEREIAVACPALVADGIAPGDSVAVSGTCLTAEKVESPDSHLSGFTAGGEYDSILHKLAI